jgi:hypothetical protein
MFEAFARAVYQETVLVWSLGMYGTGVLRAMSTAGMYLLDWSRTGQAALQSFVGHAFAGLLIAATVPNFYEKNKKDMPENPPTLKEV